MPAYCKKNSEVWRPVHRFSENIEAAVHALEMRKSPAAVVIQHNVMSEGKGNEDVMAICQRIL